MEDTIQDHLANAASGEATQPAAVDEYVPLKGEGDVKYIKRTMRRHDCDVCGEAADYRLTYLLEGDCRRNPASSAYGKDDCSWCSDAERFVCKDHQSARPMPDRHSWAGSFPLVNFPHLGLYVHDEKIPAPTAA